MKSENKINVLLYRHMFKCESEIFELKRCTFREIYKQLDLKLPIEYYIFIDGDVQVQNYSKFPQCSEVYVKATFAGDGGGAAGEDEGKDMMTGGAIAFGLAILTGPLAPIVAIGGMLSMAYGYWLYVQPGTSSYSSTAEPSISGASNSLRNNEKIPVLLGRHLIAPWYAAVPYASYDAIAEKTLVDDSKYQYLNMLMGNTYANAKIHEDSIYLGDTPFTTYQEDDASYALIDFQEDSALPTYYPVLITQTDTSLSITRGDTDDYDDPIDYIRTCSESTYKVELIFQFPNGLYKTKDGSYYTHSVGFNVWWKHVDADDDDYVGINSDGTSSISISGKEKSTRRFKVTKEFDNNTSSSSEYNADRQYTFKIQRTTRDDSDSEYSDSDYSRNSSSYLEAIKSYTGIFDGTNDPDTYPILPATQAKLNICSLQVKATDVLSGTIDDLNYEMTAYMPVYSGTGTGPDSWSYGLTRNPASAFLYVLTNSYVNQDPIEEADLETRIDYDAVETWYNFCEDLELQCNAYLLNDETVEDVLKSICSVGFASWNVVDNQYTIYIDTYNDTITQLFTPRNSYSYIGTKTFADIPTGISVTFVNSDQSDDDDDDDQSSGGFEEEVRYVYADGRDDSDPTDDDDMATTTIFGAVTSEQAYRIGIYILACTRLRPEQHKFSVDIEHVMCTRWDRIKLQHDVPLLGLSSGRILAPIESDGETVGFTSDEVLSYETGLSYGVEIRYADGSITNHTVQNLETDTRSILFDTAIADVDVLFQDDLFSFGEAGSETLDLIITDIEASDNESATITCVDYDETIYDLYMEDSSVIPDYVSKVSSSGASGSLSLNTYTETQDEANETAATTTTTANQVTYRVSAVSDTGYAITTVSAFSPDIYESTGSVNYMTYVNYDNGNYVYSGYISSGATGTQLNAVSSKSPRYYNDGTQIVYINVEDGNSLYLKSSSVLETGTQIYSGNVYDFAINPVNDNIFIYDYDNVYELDSSDSYSVINTTSLSIISAVIASSGTVYYVKTEDGFIYSNTTDFDDEVLFYSGDVVQQVNMALEEVTVYFIKSDLLIYYKEESETDTSTATAVEYGTTATGSFDVDSDGNLVYSNNYTGTIYVVNASTTIQNAELSSEVFTHTFTGTTTIGSEVVTDVDTDDLDVLSVGDAVIGTGISDSTYIKYLGNSFLTMTQVATSSVPSGDILATGSRIIMNANKVIIEGSIEARLLSASAINSKARDDNGDYITEFDLDNGTADWRKQDGTTVLSFDPNRESGAELQLAGTMSSANFVTGADGDGWEINDDGNAEFNSVKIRGFTMPTSGSEYKVYVKTTPTEDDEYATLAEALADLSRSYMTFVDGGVEVIVEYEDGYTITEQTTISNIDLGWITIESAGTTVYSSDEGGTISSVFLIEGGAVAPKINTRFTNTDATRSHTFMVCTGQSKANLTLCVLSNYSSGIQISEGSAVFASWLVCSDCQYGVYLTSSGQFTSSYRVDCTSCAIAGISINNNSSAGLEDFYGDSNTTDIDLNQGSLVADVLNSDSSASYVLKMDESRAQLRSIVADAPSNYTVSVSTSSVLLGKLTLTNQTNTDPVVRASTASYVQIGSGAMSCASTYVYLLYSGSIVSATGQTLSGSYSNESNVTTLTLSSSGLLFR